MGHQLRGCSRDWERCDGGGYPPGEVRDNGPYTRRKGKCPSCGGWRILQGVKNVMPDHKPEWLPSQRKRKRKLCGYPVETLTAPVERVITERTILLEQHLSE